MKTDQTTLLVVAIFTCTINLNCFAQSGTNGGGQGYYVGKKLVFRDNHDPSSCSVKTGITLLEEGKMPILDSIHSLARYNRYFSYRLLQEFKQMSFCFVTNLKTLPSEDVDGFTFNNQHFPTVAIRTYGDGKKEARVELKVFNQFDPLEQAHTLIHETAHSFIRADVPARNEKMRSLGNLIFSIEGGQAILQRDFDASLRMFEVQTEIGEYANALGAALDPEVPIQTAQALSRELNGMAAKALVKRLADEEENRFLVERIGVVKQYYNRLPQGLTWIFRRGRDGSPAPFGACKFTYVYQELENSTLSDFHHGGWRSLILSSLNLQNSTTGETRRFGCNEEKAKNLYLDTGFLFGKSRRFIQALLDLGSFHSFWSVNGSGHVEFNDSDDVHCNFPRKEDSPSGMKWPTEQPNYNNLEDFARFSTWLQELIKTSFCDSVFK